MSELSAGARRRHARTRRSRTLLEPRGRRSSRRRRHGLLRPTSSRKRVASRLLRAVPHRCSAASSTCPTAWRRTCCSSARRPRPADGRAPPRLAAARAAYGLAERDARRLRDQRLGRFDPASSRRRASASPPPRKPGRRPPAARCTGSPGLSDQFALVGDSLRKLFPSGEAFAAELQAAVAQTQQAQAAPPAGAGHGSGDQRAVPRGRVRGPRLRPRPSTPSAPPPGRAPGRASARAGRPSRSKRWMEELYRRVSDRQTMGSVVRRAARLAERAREGARPVLPQPRGPRRRSATCRRSCRRCAACCRCSAWTRPSHAVLRMRERSTAWSRPRSTRSRPAPPASSTGSPATVGALGFLIDMLNYQPPLAKTLFVYDAADRQADAADGPQRLAPTPRAPAAPVEPRLIEQAQMLAFSSVREDVPLQDVTRDLERLSHEAQAADQPALAAAVLEGPGSDRAAPTTPRACCSARGDLSEALVDFVATATEPIGLAPVQRAGAAAAPSTPATPGRRDLERRRRDARHLPRGSARGDQNGRRPPCGELARQPGRPRRADDACAAPSTRSRAARAWSGLKRIRRGRLVDASRCSTPGWPTRSRPADDLSQLSQATRWRHLAAGSRTSPATSDGGLRSRSHVPRAGRLTRRTAAGARRAALPASQLPLWPAPRRPAQPAIDLELRRARGRAPDPGRPRLAFELPTVRALRVRAAAPSSRAEPSVRQHPLALDAAVARPELAAIDSADRSTRSPAPTGARTTVAKLASRSRQRCRRPVDLDLDAAADAAG